MVVFDQYVKEILFTRLGAFRKSQTDSPYVLDLKLLTRNLLLMLKL
jgi:hypothetical protein